MGPEAGTLSPAVSAGLNPITPPLAAPAGGGMAPGADAIMAGANPATSFGTSMSSATPPSATTPDAAKGGLWDKITGYSENPYVQEVFKTGVQQLKKPSAGGSMSPFPDVQMPVVSPAQDHVDRLAWLRAFGVQG
jgi:hypothetical protein